ncbi:MAG: TldD/PmbA family protein [Candidatus Bathyarchaeia archaeon]
MQELAHLAVDYARELGADYAEAKLESASGNIYLMKNGNPEVAGFLREQGVGVRVLVNGGLNFVSFNKPDRSLVKRRVKEAVKTAKASVRVMKKPISLSSEKSVEERWEVKPKIAFGKISVKEKIELLSDIDKTVSSPDEVKTFVPSRVLQLIESTTEKYFVNSEGTTIISKLPQISFVAFLVAHEKGETEQDYIQMGESRGWEAVEGWKLIDHARERAKTLGKILKTGGKAPKGKIDLILGNQIAGLMAHESTGHPYEADRIFGREAAQAGESFITREMIGKKIGSDKVTVADDPTLKNSYGYYLYDDEGVLGKRRFLMKKGVVNEFLHNRETAAEMGVSSNGAARSSGFNREPIVRMANTFILPGDHTFDELVEGIHLGVYIKTFGEWSIDDRRYSMRFLGRECYLIEKGELKGMIRHPILEMTTPGFYSSIDALDKSLVFEAALCGKGEPDQAIPVWHGAPNVRVRQVRLGGIE